MNHKRARTLGVVLWACTAIACNDGKGGQQESQPLDQPADEAEAEGSDEPPEVPPETEDQEHAEAIIEEPVVPEKAIPVPLPAMPMPKSVDLAEGGFVIPDAAVAPAQADAGVVAFWENYPLLPSSIVVPFPEGLVELCQPTEVMLSQCKAQVTPNDPNRYALEECITNSCDRDTAQKQCLEKVASGDAGVSDAGVVNVTACVDAILRVTKPIRKCEADQGRFDGAAKGVQLNPLTLSRLTMCIKQMVPKQ